MDNVSHSVAGLVLSRVGLNRVTPHASLLLLISANIPDIDIVALAKSQLNYLEAHRGPTHALSAVPVMAFISISIAAAILRKELPWLRAFAVCIVGVLSHLLLDWTNAYGIRLLLPFSPRWSHLDLNQLTDAWILAVLALAALWPWFSGLVAGEIGEARALRGRGIAIAAFVVCLSYEGLRFVMHNQALAQLSARLYSGEAPASVAALPSAVNPFRWLGIVETNPAYWEYQVNTLGDFDPGTGREHFRSPASEVSAAVRATPQFRFFLYFARFPVWSIQPVSLNDGTGKRTELADLRFGEPGRGSFHCVAVEDPGGKVIASWYTYGNGAGLGFTDPRSRR